MKPSCLFVFFTILWSQTLGLKQVIELYHASNCETDPSFPTGPIIITNETTNYFIAQSNTQQFRSASVLGMWQIAKCNGSSQTTPCAVGMPVSDYIAYTDNYGSCQSLDNDTVATTVLVRRLGDSSMQAPELHLYAQQKFQPSSLVTIVRMAGQSNIRNGSIRSYFFTGDYWWTIYEEADFRGRSHCLRPEQVVRKRGFGITFEPNFNGTIRSVRHGCSSGMGLTASVSLFLLYFITLGVSVFYSS